MQEIYFFNVVSGELCYSTQYNGEDVPENATLKNPPEVKENQTPIFKEGEWVIVSDYRFTHKMIDSENNIKFIEELGDIPEDCRLITMEEAKELEEIIRINNLTMTPLDFINFLKACGLTLEQIHTYLDSNLEIKTQLTYCDSVYCGVAKALMPIKLGEITITAEMVEAAFIEKNPVEEPEQVEAEVI